ncbi:MAG: flagellar biosynthetic protein FliO [Deltaproteobacteria bacterium]|nr:flagellar biosynthetic protein FliO [Deltaproteobacteria bacterium]
MKLINKICRARFFFLLSGILFIGNLYDSSAGAAELGFKATAERMLFTIPYEIVPEVNALFSDQGERVVLVLPASGLKAEVQEHALDDDWVTAFGVERDGQKLCWYLKKRDPALKVKSFLALERKKSALQVVLLKEYHSWTTPENSDKPATLIPAAQFKTRNSGKMARIKQLLEGVDGADYEVVNEDDKTSEPAPSLLMSGLRSLVVLVFLALVIWVLSLFLKRYRRGRRGFGGSGLVKVLGVETVTAKHQVMLLELLDEVMVVGISGEQMTVLTTIKDPGKVEELRLLKDSSPGGRRFGGYLKSFLERDEKADREPPVSDSRESVAVASYQRSAIATSEKSEELPENYQEVVSQIKDRLKNGDRSRQG